MKMRIDSINVPEGRRELKNLDTLIESIREIGLINPITVKVGGILVAGYHRLEACKRLGWEMISFTLVEAKGLKAELI